MSNTLILTPARAATVHLLQILIAQALATIRQARASLRTMVLGLAPTILTPLNALLAAEMVLVVTIQATVPLLVDVCLEEPPTGISLTASRVMQRVIEYTLS